MADTMLNQYVPDYLLPPGEVMEEYLEAYSTPQTELAARTGLTKKTINEIIKGKFAMVKTEVQQHGKFVSLDYKLIKEKGNWKVYDFIISGVSMIRNYRSQFSKTLKEK